MSYSLSSLTTISKSDIGLNSVENLKVKLNATAAPTVNNDTSEGYVVGSRWIDVTNDKEYVCLDKTDGAAVWKLTSATTTSEVTEGSNLYYTNARFDTRLGTKSTTNLTEGSNLYYTEARVSANTDVAANVTHAASSSNPHTVTKAQVSLGNVEDLKVKLDATAAPTVNNDTSEGYVVGSRWIDVTNDKEYVCLDNTDGAAVWKLTSATTTSDVAEGSNLYYTDARFDTSLGTKSTTNLTEGTNLYYTDARFDTRLGTKDTGNLTEGSNLYYTDARADARITTQKGAANGLATLDGGGKVPASQLDLDSVDYQGTWNATTNAPTLVSSTGTKGYYYVVSVAGSTSIDGITDWQVGDWIIFNGTVWEKADHTDQVTSVAGKQGAVTLVSADITDLTTSAVDEGSNLYYTEARVSANTDVAANVTHAASSSNPHSVTKAQVSLGNVEDLKVKLDATIAPTVNNDTSEGYVVGSRWIDVTNDKEYVCLDNTDGAAVWKLTSATTTSEVSEGSNLYYTDARFDTRLGTKTTTNLTEGSNLYYTEARVSANTDVAANVTHAASSSNPHTVTKAQVGLGNVADLKVKLDATAAPTATDDSAAGYAVGSRWVDVTNDKEYVCVDSTATAAVWKLTSATTTSDVSEGSNLYYTEARVSANTDVAANVTHAASSSNPHTVTKAQVGLGNVADLKVKLDATVAPVATDDSAAGYAVGSRWVDVTNDKEYVCVDSTATAAVWKLTSATTTSDVSEGSNLYYTDARFDTRLGIKTTTNLTEGSNLYYTEARVSANTDVAANVTHAASSSNPHSVTKAQVSLGNVEDLKVKLDATAAPTVNNDTSEGYVVGSRWIDVTNDKEYVCLDNTDTAAVWKLTSATTTSEIAEGSNLYYTDTRFDTRLGTKSTTNLTEGTNLYYTDARFDTRLGTKDTGNLTEGSNLYYTDARADARITTQKGAANGLATLDGGGKVPASQLDLDSVDYQGTWNATTNAPTLVSSTGTKGYYYVVSVAGSTSIDGITDWQVGDWIIFNGTVWEKADHTDQVTSVAGKQGAVTLVSADITDLTTSNVTEGSNLYYTEARVSANTDVAANVTHAASSSNPHTVTKAQVSLGNVEDLKVKLDATIAPTVNNDTSEGYVVGSRWIDVTNDKEYVCLDKTDGAAVWKLTSATTTSEVSEGSNLYYTDARFDTRLGTKTTTNLTEGSNLYYTEARVSANTDVAANVTHAASSSNPHTVTKAQVGLGNVADLKVKLDATAAPTATDDSAAGYAVGSRWVDVTNDKEYVCVDSTATAAVWKLTSATTTSDVSEGSNLYYTDTRFDTRLGTKTTTNLTEGSNLYYTEARVSANTDVAANVTHAASSSNPHTVTKAQVGLGNVQNLKVKLDATAAPTATDDSAAGYAVGSRWVDVTNDKEYVCVDSTATAAVWLLTTETVSDLPALSIKRTTAFTTSGTGNTYTDITFNTTVLENDANIIEHHNTSTERVTIKETGAYQISFAIPIIHTNITIATARIYKNGTTEVGDSEVHSDHEHGDSYLDNTVVASLTQNDYITLQAKSDGISEVTGTPIVLSVIRLKGFKGDKGDTGSGANLTIKDEGTSVTNTPHNTLNFTGSLVVVTDNADGSANVTIAGPSGAVVGTTDTQTLTNKTVTGSTNTVGATQFETTGAAVVVSGSAVPSAGQMLIASSATVASWAMPTIYKYISAGAFDSPNNTDWTINALAPAIADSSNNALVVRAFDATTEEGIGFDTKIPTGYSSVTLEFTGRAATAPAGTRTVGVKLYYREIKNNAAIGTWSSKVLTDVSIPTNANYQHDTETIAFTGFTPNLNANSVYQFELTRINPTAGTELTGDWLLLNMGVNLT